MEKFIVVFIFYFFTIFAIEYTIKLSLYRKVRKFLIVLVSVIFLFIFHRLCRANF